VTPKFCSFCGERLSVGKPVYGLPKDVVPGQAQWPVCERCYKAADAMSAEREGK
jgi:ribosome-binding protein aMBF1 (putative translation factor)